MSLNNYVIASQLVKYLKKRKKMTLNDIGNKHLKKIFIEKFINELVRIKCG